MFTQEILSCFWNPFEFNQFQVPGFLNVKVSAFSFGFLGLGFFWGQSGFPFQGFAGFLLGFRFFFFFLSLLRVRRVNYMYKGYKEF